MTALARVGRGPLASWAAAASLLLLVGFSSGVRIHTVLASPLFDSERSEGLLRSDPGLLFYLTSRVVGAGGGVPLDWRADPRIEHPGVVDVPAVFTVGQEFIIAWAWRLLGGDVPLHVFCVVVMGLVASLATVGVYGLARGLTASRTWGVVAAALFVSMPAGYRTLGFILVREDLSLPLFALHLALLAGAWRSPSTRAFVSCGAALGAALATWHAMTFIAALEAACIWVWYLRSGENLLAAHRAWTGLVVLALIAVGVPVLREKVALLSPPLAIGAALFACSRLGVDDRPLQRLAVSAAIVAGALGLGGVVGSGDFGHVVEVMIAKLVHLGRLPVDPLELSFEARMMWQGPFGTLEPIVLWRRFGPVLLLSFPFALAALWRAASPTGNRDAAGAALVSLLLVAGVVLGLLVSRLLVIAAIAAPVVGGLALRRATSMIGSQRVGVVLAVVVCAIQAIFFARWLAGPQLGWYLPEVRRVEMEALVDALPRFVPEGEAVTSDFMISTAVLAQTNRPIVLQPKWERAATRERLETFWLTFYGGTPEDLRRLVVETFESRWLLVDRSTMLLSGSSRYLGGLEKDAPELPHGSAAERLLGRDPRVLRSIPGYHLVYRSPGRWLLPDGSTSDFFRLYRLDPL